MDLPHSFSSREPSPVPPAPSQTGNRLLRNASSIANRTTPPVRLPIFLRPATAAIYSSKLRLLSGSILFNGARNSRGGSHFPRLRWELSGPPQIAVNSGLRIATPDSIRRNALTPRDVLWLKNHTKMAAPPGNTTTNHARCSNRSNFSCAISNRSWADPLVQYNTE
jgi:hypothetical protein